MQRFIKRVTLFWLLSCAVALSAAAQTITTEQPAERRAREFVRLLDAGKRADLTQYIQENFSPRFRAVPTGAHQDFFSSVYDQTRGVELHSFQNAKPTEVTALLKSKLTGQWLALLVRIEAEAPHRIDGLGLRPPQAPAHAQPAGKLTNNQLAKELKTLLEKLAGADVFSGAVLLAKDGVPVFQGAYGMANKDFSVPNRLDTKFNLGSMNKMFTAVAIAQLVERGKLSFDDPLAKFLPDFPDKDAAQKIQIKHLLSHTAGLGGYFSKKWDESSRALYRTVDDMLKLAAASEKLLFEPGTRWQYSNTGMLVLGKVIEKVSGQSYYDYVRENISKPAGMLNTDCYELDRVNPNLAVGYEKQYGDNGITFTNNIFMHVMRGGPQGGGYSTVEDLLKFERALRGNKLVGAAYVQQLLTTKPELKSPNYGYGFSIEREGNIVGHSGGFPGINSNLDIFVGTGWTAIVMSNYGRGAQPVQQKMRELVRAMLEAQTATSAR